MNTELENFAVQLTDAAKTHEEWQAIVRFGLGTLLENQSVLAEIITREATREAARFNQDRVTGLHEPSDHVSSILAQLGLKLCLS